MRGAGWGPAPRAGAPTGPRLAAAALGVAIVAAACATPEGADAGAARRACAAGPTLEGVDVSAHQGAVDWGAVKASGRAFAFARVSDGLRFVDERFDENWAGMKAAGLARGAYQFFRPGQDALAQADLMVLAVGPLGPGDLPPVVDVEASDGQSSEAVVAGLRAWLGRVAEGTGRQPMIYAAANFWGTLAGASEFGANPLWVANYGAACPRLPGAWAGWAFWQYGDGGSVPGVVGAVDVDKFNGTLEQLQALAGEAGPTP